MHNAADGTCVIDVFHKDGVSHDYGNFRQILTAAASVVSQCVQENSDHVGGYVRDIGKDSSQLRLGRATTQVTRCRLTRKKLIIMQGFLKTLSSSSAPTNQR